MVEEPRPVSKLENQKEDIPFTKDEVLAIQKCYNAQSKVGPFLEGTFVGVITSALVNQMKTLRPNTKLLLTIFAGITTYSSARFRQLRICVDKIKIMQENGSDPTSMFVQSSSLSPQLENRTAEQSEFNWDSEKIINDGIPDLTEPDQNEIVPKKLTVYEELRQKHQQKSRQSSSRIPQGVMTKQSEEDIVPEPQVEFAPKVSEQPQVRRPIRRNIYGDIVE